MPDTSGFAQHFSTPHAHELDRVAARRRAMKIEPDGTAASVEDHIGRALVQIGELRKKLNRAVELVQQVHEEYEQNQDVHVLLSGFVPGCERCRNLQARLGAAPVEEMRARYAEALGRLQLRRAQLCNRYADAISLGIALKDPDPLPEIEAILSRCIRGAHGCAGKHTPGCTATPPAGAATAFDTCRDFPCQLRLLREFLLAFQFDLELQAASLAERAENGQTAAARDRAKKMDLFGVCFSGGGIRSATFSLGILQALGKLKLLRQVDYLSTVSGGGYIGGWLAGWIRRETDGLTDPPGQPTCATPAAAAREAVYNVEKQLDPDRIGQTRSHRRMDDRPDAYREHFAEDAEPSPIHHLRAHSRYLAPATGLLSLDRWVLFAIYLRNLFVNALIAVPLLALLTLIVRAAVRAFADSWEPSARGSGCAFAVLLLMLLLGRITVDYWLNGVRHSAVEKAKFGGWLRFGLFFMLASSGALGTWLLAPIHPHSPDVVAIKESDRSRMPDAMRPSHVSTESSYELAQGVNDWAAEHIGIRPASSYFHSALLFCSLAGVSLAFVGLRLLLGKIQRRVGSRENDWPAALGAFALLAVPIVIAWMIGFLWQALTVFVGLSVLGLLGSAALALVGWLIPKGVWLTFKKGVVFTVTTFAYGIAFGLLLAILVNEFLYMGTSRPALFAALAPPLFLLAFWLAGFLEVAVAGGWISDYEREWRSRFGAWILLIAVGWAAVFATVIYLPQYLDNHGGTASVSAIGLLSAAVRYLVPRLTKSPGLMTWVAVRVVPVIFLVALLGLVASGVDRVLSGFDPEAKNPQRAAPFQAVGGGWVDLLRESLPPDSEPTAPFQAISGGWAALPFEPHQDLRDCVAATAGGWARLLIPDSYKGLGGRAPHSFKVSELPPSNLNLKPISSLPANAEWSYAERLERNSWSSIRYGAIIAGTLLLLFLCVVPVNRFSLHALYANRLIRCYLGASRRAPSYDTLFSIPTATTQSRRANSFSKFDPDDDVPLVRLRAGTVTTGDIARKSADVSHPYYGPYPLFNTTLNMISGPDLAYQDRRGESFVLTPDYCGSESTGYALLNGQDTRDTEYLAKPDGPYWNLTVGRAITISGAAVDANMTNYYSPQFTAFLTLMNARLGWWIENPYRELSEPGWLRRRWRDAKTFLKESLGLGDHSPVFLHRLFRRIKTGLKQQMGYERTADWEAAPPVGSWPYVKEMLGYTDATQSSVHLSDGGHYENTGAYELIRRRCRFILLVDAAENPDNTSENLANLVRVVYSDFGIRIAIDTAPLKRGPDGRTTWHCAVGAIRYDDVDAGGVIGTLLFVRSSLTGDEPADIKNYASVVPVFPHHPTADQFFDEAQFESYRGLGFHIGMAVLAEAAEAARLHGSERFNRRFFAKLRRTWTPNSALQNEKYVDSCRDFLRQIAATEDLAQRRRLTGDLTDALRHATPQANPRAATNSEEDREQVQRAQLMEMAWMMNDLDHSYSHPIQRGWVNTMRQWASTPAFQRMWPEIRGVFSQGFVRFCERALNVNQPSVLLLPSAKIAAPFAEEWAEMKREFGQEFLSFFATQDKGGGAWWDGPAEEYLERIRTAPGAKLWLIGYGSANESDRILTTGQADRIQHVVGAVALFPPLIPRGTPSNTELLLWIRGPYRMAGIGGVALRELKPTLQGHPFARLPRIGSGSAELMQRAIWVQFMNDFDFYGVRSPGVEAAEWERREIRVQLGR